MSFIQFLEVLAVFLFLILAPGFFIFNLLVKDKTELDILEAIPISFAFGIFLFVLIGIPAYVFHCPWPLFIFLLVVAFILLLWLNWHLLNKQKRILNFAKITPAFWIALAVSLFSVIIVVLMNKSMVYGDQIYHIGVARRLASGDFITPFFNLFKDIPGKVDAAYGYNVWHLSLASFMRTLPVEPNIIWKYLISIIAPVEVLAFYFLSKRFSQSSIFVSIAMVIFLITEGILTIGWEWRLAPYPDQVGRNLIVLVALGLWLMFLKKEKIDKGLLLGIIFLGVTLISIHMFSVIYFLIAVVGMMVFSFLAEKKYQIFKKGLYVLGGWLVLGAPLLFLKFLAYKDIVPTHAGTNTTTKKLIMMGDYFIVNPSIWNSPWTIAAIIALVILVFSFLFKNKKLPLAVLFSLVLIVFAAIFSFIPPVATFVGKIITSTYLARLASIIPVVLLISFFIYKAFSLLKIQKKYLAIIIGILSLVAIFYTFQKANFFKEIGASLAKQEYFLYNNQLFDFINTSIPKDAVIATSVKNNPDKVYGLVHSNAYDLFAATSDHLVMISPSHCPAIVEKQQRVDDIFNILDPEINSSITKQLLTKYQVDYILAENNEISKFSQQPDDYREIYNQELPNGHFAIYKVMP